MGKFRYPFVGRMSDVPDALVGALGSNFAQAATEAWSRSAFLGYSLLTAKGDLIAGTGAGTASRLAVGADGTYLRALSSAATGLEWTADPINKTLVDAKGDTLVGTADNTVARRAAPSNLWTPVADSAQSDGWRNELLATQQSVDDLREEYEEHHHDARYGPRAVILTTPLIGGLAQVASGAETVIDNWSVESFDPYDMHSTSTNPGRITVRESGVYAITARMLYAAAAVAGTITYLYIRKNGAGVLDIGPIIPWVNSAATGTSVNAAAIDNAVPGDYYEVVLFQNTGAARTFSSARFALTRV